MGVAEHNLRVFLLVKFCPVKVDVLILLHTHNMQGPDKENFSNTKDPKSMQK
jgi:hypothetical protein